MFSVFFRLRHPHHFRLLLKLYNIFSSFICLVLLHLHNSFTNRLGIIYSLFKCPNKCNSQLILFSSNCAFLSGLHDDIVIIKINKRSIAVSVFHLWLVAVAFANLILYAFFVVYDVSASVPLTVRGIHWKGNKVMTMCDKLLSILQCTQQRTVRFVDCRYSCSGP